MDIDVDGLIRIRKILMERYDVPQTTAEYAARLYPYLRQYPHSVTAPWAAAMLERSVRHTKEHFARLRERGVFERDGAWKFRREVKEVLDASY